MVRRSDGLGTVKVAGLAAFLLLSGKAMAASDGIAAEGSLAKPLSFTAVNGAVPHFDWTPVSGAALYRLAIFDAPDAQGHKALLAAVWVSQTAWTYGLDPVLAKVGSLPSTKLQALPVGHNLHAMVRAADPAGDKLGPWTALSFGYFPVSLSQAAETGDTAAEAVSPTAESGTAEADTDSLLDMETGPNTESEGLRDVSKPVSATGCVRDDDGELELQDESVSH